MESLTLFVLIGLWVLLGLLARRFGVDSRTGMEAPSPGRLWVLPSDEASGAERSRV